MWIYATKPVGAILGYVVVAGVSKGPPATMWKIFGDSAKVGREHFDNYFHEAKVAVCISLRGAREGEALLAEHFKTVRPKFHPPQLFTRLSEYEASYLQNMIFPVERVAKA